MVWEAWSIMWFMRKGRKYRWPIGGTEDLRLKGNIIALCGAHEYMYVNTGRQHLSLRPPRSSLKTGNCSISLVLRGKRHDRCCQRDRGSDRDPSQKIWSMSCNARVGRWLENMQRPDALEENAMAKGSWPFRVCNHFKRRTKGGDQRSTPGRIPRRCVHQMLSKCWAVCCSELCDESSQVELVRCCCFISHGSLR